MHNNRIEDIKARLITLINLSNDAPMLLQMAEAFGAENHHISGMSVAEYQHRTDAALADVNDGRLLSITEAKERLGIYGGK